MKYTIILCLLVTLSLTAGAQVKHDPVNYVLVYRDTVRGPLAPRDSVASYTVGFASVADVNSWLNSRTPVIDSSRVVGVYDIRRNKPLAKGYTEVEREKRERVRERQWSIKP